MSERRLGKSDWIRHGLLTLAAEGPQALKAGPMAAKLKVSRGSFYWHFEDVADFRAQLLAAWQERTTERVIRDLEAHPEDPGRLRRLMHGAMGGRRRLERAIRAWAAGDDDVAAAVAAVDARRIGHVARLLVASGIAPARAEARATFLYWAYLGQPMVMDLSHAAIDVALLDEIVGRLET